jgi:hypothetical protein
MKCNHIPALPKRSYLWPLHRKADYRICKCRKCGKSVILENYPKVRWIWFFSCLAVYVLYCIIEYLREYTTRSTDFPFGDATPYIIFLAPIVLLGIISRIAERAVLPRLKWIEYIPPIASADNDMQKEVRGLELMEEYSNNNWPQK